MNQAITQQPEIVFLDLSFQILGGYKRATDEDIAAAGGVLPKTDVLTRGGKHIYPSEKLAPFHAEKKQLMRELSKVSVKTIGGAMAFEKAELKDIEELIKESQKRFAALLVEFRQSYAPTMAGYIAAQKTPGLAKIITDSALTVDEAASRFGFSYEMYVPQPIGENTSVESMFSNLVGRLYAEVAQASYEIWDKSLMPMDGSGNRNFRKPGQKTKRPLVTLRDKLTKLARLDNNIQNSVDLIDDVLAATQKQGFLEDTPSNPCCTRFVRLVELMMDAQNFRSASTVVFDGIDEVDRLLGLTAKPVPEKVEVKEEAPAVHVEPVVAAAAVAKTASRNRFSNFL